MHHLEENAKVQRVHIPKERRIIAMCDIHGNLPFFKALLAQMEFSTDDVLILVGDLLEKGVYSLDTLRYVMELSRTHTVYPVCGNCDRLVLDLVEHGEGEPEADAYFDHCHKLWGERLMMAQMAAEIGLPCRGAMDLPALRKALPIHFKNEVEFLHSFPHILETDTHIFVHGGIPREDNLEDLVAWSCMKNDNFLSQGHTFQKWVVVGHWPVTLYHPHIPVAHPLIDHVHHVISMDGGCVLKVDGQLNGLSIQNDSHSYEGYDGLPAGIALQDQAASTQSVNVRWGDNLIEVLTWGEEYCRCRHQSTGRELDILTAYIYQHQGQTRCEDATDYHLPITAGDRLHVVYRGAERALVKKDGITGWYVGGLQCQAPIGLQTKDFRNIP